MITFLCTLQYHSRNRMIECSKIFYIYFLASGTVLTGSSTTVATPLPFKVTPENSAFVRVALLREASVRSALEKSAFVRVALSREASVRSASPRKAPVKSAP
jgi:hypothetical protein